MRAPAIVVVTCVAALASIASAPQGGSVVEGKSDPQPLTLAPGDAKLFDVRATLAQGGSGTGDIAITAKTDDGSTGGFHFELQSSTSGEKNQTDVLDPTDQPETSLSIAAFAGCGDDKCAEDTQVTFSRAAEETTSLSFTWTVDATFTPDLAGDNSIAIDIHAGGT